MDRQFNNRTIFTGDNLPILRNFNSESVDLIYLDPPFNSNRTYAAPIGSRAAGASFKDAWTLEDVDDAWLDLIKNHHPKLTAIIDAIGSVGGESNKSYSVYMAIRLLELHRILKPTGSIYLHCDPTMSHSLKLVMDAILGATNFRNEIVWGYRTGGVSKRYFPKKHDILLVYGKGTSPKHNPIQETKQYTKPFFIGKDAKPNKDGLYDVEVFVRDVWDNEIKPVLNLATNRTGYPIQKPLKLLERIIKASSAVGDLVLDPFCGCATTLVAAENLGRHWIGIDISPKTLELAKERLQKRLIENDDKITHRTDIPARADIDAKSSKNITKTPPESQAGFCSSCEEHFQIRDMQLDHIVPKAHSGTDTDDNLQLLCGACSLDKATGAMAELMVKL